MSATAADRSPASGDGDEESSGPAEALTAAHTEARQRAEAGDLTGARTLLEDALTVGEVQLGHDHPRLAPLMVDLATIARGLGNLTEALAQLRRAYAIVAATGGPEHPTSLSIEGRLAAVMYRLNEPTEAYDWHLADVGTRILGPEHPAVKGAQQRLSDASPEASLDQPEPVGPAWTPSVDVDPGLYGRAAANQSWDPEEPGLAPTFAQPSYSPSAPSFHPSSSTYIPSAPGVYQRQSPTEGIYVPSAAHDHQPIDVWQSPDPSRSRRGHGGGIALVGGLGAVVLVAAAVVAYQLFGPSSPPTSAAPPTSPPSATAAPTPTVSLPPAPSNVVLVDNGGSVTLTWRDPSAGEVPFIVAGGRAASASTPLETIPPGKTTSTIYGLNVDFDYCFTVAAVWSSALVVPSIRTCTHRLSTTASP